MRFGPRDEIAQQIIVAHAAGVTTALVLTGLTTPEQAASATGDRKPDLIFPDLAAAKAATRSDS